MFSLRILRLVVVGAVLAVLSQEAAAAEPAKTECPKECQARAKAAFAFAKLKAEAATQPTAAPMPKAKLCPCGDGCKCEPVDCPSKCPASALGSVGKAQPAPTVGPPVRRIVGYTCGVDQYGRRVCVPVYEQ
jgi:hypothetical protein